MECKALWASDGDRLTLIGVLAIVPGATFDDFAAERDIKRELKLKDLSEKLDKAQKAADISDAVVEYHLSNELHAFAVKQLKAAVESRKVMLSSADGLLKLRDHLDTAKDIKMEPAKDDAASEKTPEAEKK